MTSCKSVSERVSEWIKLAELAMVMVGGSVEDERLFSTMDFVKNKLRNRLSDHLEVSVRMKAQHVFDIETFPYGEACEEWTAARTVRGRYGV